MAFSRCYLIIKVSTKNSTSKWTKVDFLIYVLTVVKTKTYKDYGDQTFGLI